MWKEILKTYISREQMWIVKGDCKMDMGQLNWKKVVTSDGITIGEVEGGELDTKSSAATLQVTHVHVGLNDLALKEFGLKKPFLGQAFVCLPVDMVREANEVVTLKQSLGELKNEPACREFGTK